MSPLGKYAVRPGLLRLTAVLSVVLLLSACGWFGPDLPKAEEGFRHLFNGRNLDNWVTLGDPPGFSVESEAIRALPEAKGSLLSADRFGDFELLIELELTEGASTAILFRASKDAASGYRLNLQRRKGEWRGSIGAGPDYQHALSSALLQTDTSAESAVAGSWASLKLIAKGHDLSVQLDGQPLLNLPDSRRLQGHIVLLPGDRGETRWRNVQIKENGVAAFSAQGFSEPAFWERPGEGRPQTAGASLQVDKSGLRSRRQLSGFAAEIVLSGCSEAHSLQFQTSVEAEGATLSFSSDSAILSHGEFSYRQLLDGKGRQRVSVAVAEGTLHVAINGKHFPVLRGLPAQGWIVAEAKACETPLLLNDLQWISSQTPVADGVYRNLDNRPARVFTAEQATAMFSLPDDMTIEAIAAEPMVQDPVAMAWDEAGRLFVVEMRGFMPDAYGGGEDRPVGRVVMLEDTDSDGHMDRHTVFLDGLVMPRAVAVVNEGLLVAEPPSLWLCPDIRGKVRCENRQRLGEYAVDYQTVSMEHLENGLMTGLDNWLYNAKSSRRLRIVDGKLHSQDTLARGQWGIAKDDSGRLFYNTNSNFLSGEYYPANEVLGEDTDALIEGLFVPIAREDEVFSIRVNPGVNRAYLDDTLRADGRLKAPTAVSGLTVYRGGLFPGGINGDVIVPEPAANAVVQLRLDNNFEVSASHITYPDPLWQQREFIASSDERFRPVDAKVGPDGALYIIDMYRGIIQHQAFLTDELREQIFQRDLDLPINYGRLWRVVPKTGPRPPSMRLDEANVPQLIAALSHDNGWLRDTAQRLLLVAADADNALRKAVVTAPERAAVHAVWALHGRGSLDRATLKTGLARQQATLSVQLLRAGKNLLQVEDILALKADPDSETALAQQRLFNLSVHAGEVAVQAELIKTLSSEGSGKWLQLAAIRASDSAGWEVLRAVLQKAELKASKAQSSVIHRLSAGVYRHQRRLGESGAEVIRQLLALALQRGGDRQWQQLAVLQGLAETTRADGFTPWDLGTAPALFTDTAVDEQGPLWKARLSARRAFTWPGDEVAAGLQPLGPSQQILAKKGADFFGACAGCHGKRGEGIASLAPPLAKSEWVTGPAEWLQRIILDGVSGSISVAGETWNGTMPGHRRMAALDDETLAGLMTYIRRSWGNRAGPVAVERVAEIRLATASRKQPWTAEELKQQPFKSDYAEFEGVYKVSFLSITVTEQNGELQMKVPMYGGGTMRPLEGDAFMAEAGSEKVLIRFDRDEQGRVNALLLDRGGQPITVKKIK